MNGKRHYIAIFNVFRLHGPRKINMHGLIMYIHDVLLFLANSYMYTPKQSVFLISLVYVSIHPPCFVCSISAFILSKNIELWFLHDVDYL